MDAHEELILSIVNNRHFDSLFEQLKNEVAGRMLTASVEDFIGLQAEVRAIGGLQDKLMQIANKVRMEA